MKKYPSSRILISASNSGFTIIEVLIALAIFSIGLMAVSALQSSSLMATGEIARKTEAWSILDDQAERLKSLPFYLTIIGLDKDDNGVTDTVTAGPADLTAGNHTVNALDGRYTVHWQIVDDQPIPQQDQTVIPGVPNGNYTVSKTISMQVTLVGENPLTDALAMAQFVKTWAEDGMP